MRWLCFLLSMVMHLVVLGAMVYVSAVYRHKEFCCPPAYEVTLVKTLPDIPVRTHLPEAVTRTSRPAKATAPRPRQRAASSPTRRPAPTTKPPAPAKAQPAQPTSVSKPTASFQTPPPPSKPGDAKSISPRGKDFGPLLETANWVADNATQRPRPEELPTTAKTEKGVRVVGLHGFAAFADTFSLEMAGADSFTDEEYWGHYRLGPGRFASIMGGGPDVGEGFLFYDSGTGLFRRLDRRSKMIFSYGPAFDKQRPAVGSVTILPKKDRYHNEHIRKPAQLIWLPDSPPMQYGTRVDFMVRSVPVTTGERQLDGSLIALNVQGPPRPGIVLVTQARDASRQACRPMAEALSLRGWAVLVFSCTGEVRPEDVNAALDALRRQAGVDGARVGLWGDGSGAVPVIAAASHGIGAAFAVFSGLGDARLDNARGVLVPSLWLLPSRNYRQRREALERLASARGRDFTVMEDIVPGPVPLPPGLRCGALARQWLADMW